MSRHEAKAGAVVTAWRRRYGVTPSKRAILLVCAVAEHETECGDSWPGEHNWGAVQRRPMAEAERALVRSGETPLPQDEFETLRGDSSPIHGRYQVWFWRFPTDVDGADKLLETLLDKRPSIKKGVDALTTYGLALLMYQTKYYEGFHDPRPRPGEVVPPGELTQGQLANVRAYAAALARTFSSFRTGLAMWQPGDTGEGPTSPTTPDVFPIENYQLCLRWLGFDPGPIDGLAGPKTRAAVRAFQRSEDLTADGIVGPKTWARLQQRVREATPPPPLV